MQTFLPLTWLLTNNPKNASELYALLVKYFTLNFLLLDKTRVCKQRSEAREIIRFNELRKQYGFCGKLDKQQREKVSENRNDGKLISPHINHPCTLMWETDVETLKVYFNVCVDVWCSLKNKDGSPTKNTMQRLEIDIESLTIPSFFGHKDFHSTYRGNLINKNSDFYGRHGWTDRPYEGYIWIIGAEVDDRRKTPEQVLEEQRQKEHRRLQRKRKRDNVLKNQAQNKRLRSK